MDVWAPVYVLGQERNYGVPDLAAVDEANGRLGCGSDTSSYVKPVTPGRFSYF